MYMYVYMLDLWLAHWADRLSVSKQLRYYHILHVLCTIKCHIFMYHRDQACLLYVYLILYVYVNMLIFKYTYTYFEKPVLSCRSFFADFPRQCDQANKQFCSNHGTLTWIWDVGSQWLEKRNRHPCWRAWWLVACLLFFSLDINIQGAHTATDSWECHTHQDKYQKPKFISIYTP